MGKINNKKLHRLFEETNFTYSELAENIGISRNTVHNIMFGLTNPSYYVIVSLAEALNLTPEEIMAVFFPNMNSEDSMGKLSS